MSIDGPTHLNPLTGAEDSTQSLQYDVRMDGVYFFRSRPKPPFNLSLKSGDFAYCFMVRQGTLTLKIDFPVPLTFKLKPGSIVSMSGLAPHSFASHQRIAGTPTGVFEELPISCSGSAVDEVDLIIGVVPQEPLALSSLVLGGTLLTPEDTPECARRIWKAAELLEEEFQGDGQQYNQDIIVRRIAEIMLINITRSATMYGNTATYQSNILPLGMNILKVFQSFLQNPYRDWTVKELAKIAGMSRTSFSEEFRLITGRTPIHTLSRIRLTMISRSLLLEKMSIEEAADQAGYSSAAAFVRAFQREFGLTPAKWRRRQLELEA